MTDLRKAAEMALEALMQRGEHHPKVYQAAEALRQALAQPEREWEELDVNEVREIIYENVPDPSPELLDKLYGLVASVDLWLQEKNT